MGSLGEFVRKARQRWAQRRAERHATRGERAQRRADANRLRVENRRRGPFDSGGGGV
jgi:Arc/MetJ-type ribon-helix-helix transcriptional regulator